MTAAAPRWNPAYGAATPGPCDLRLPDWAFIAWLTWRERASARAAPGLPPRLEAEMAMRRLARRLGEGLI